MCKTDPTRPADDEARTLAARLIQDARSAALAYQGLQGGRPGVSRIGLAPISEGFLTLVSDLAAHTAALRANPEATLMLGDPPLKGDPLAFPRLMVEVTARFLDKTRAEAQAAQAAYLAHQPKAALYIGFADFHLVVLRPEGALLNGGFGKAWRLSPQDLAFAPPS